MRRLCVEGEGAAEVVVALHIAVANRMSWLVDVIRMCIISTPSRATSSMGHAQFVHRSSICHSSCHLRRIGMDPIGATTLPEFDAEGAVAETVCLSLKWIAHLLAIFSMFR